MNRLDVSLCGQEARCSLILTVACRWNDTVRDLSKEFHDFQKVPRPLAMPLQISQPMLNLAGFLVGQLFLLPTTFLLASEVRRCTPAEIAVGVTYPQGLLTEVFSRDLCLFTSSCFEIEERVATTHRSRALASSAHFVCFCQCWLLPALLLLQSGANSSGALAGNVVNL